MDLEAEKRARIERKQLAQGSKTIVYGAAEGTVPDQTRRMEELCQKWDEKDRQDQARLARDVRADGIARETQQARVARLEPSNISRLPNSFFDLCDKLKGNTVEQIPAACVNNYTKLRTEALEWALGSRWQKEWGRMNMALPKLILAPTLCTTT